MTDIARIDKNFDVKTNIEKDDIKFYNISEPPFKVYGVFKENGLYRRMPENVARNVSEGVYLLHTNTAGGRVRFITDSNYVAIYAKMDGVTKFPHCAMTNTAGFDLYVGNTYINTYIPPIDAYEGFEGIIEFEKKEFKDITINFPMYSNIKELFIGIQNRAVVKESHEYKSKKPIVYYGSSITQGGCASRPGMSYQSIVSRKFDYDFVNLGFSGSAKAEDSIIEYIKHLNMSLFVYDYDHNAPSAEYLKNTHEKMFIAIRNAKKDVPIIIMSRPKYSLSAEEKQRLDIIEATYRNAIMNGDNNVYFINGRMLTDFCEDEGTVDGIHPTDFGFVAMAKALSDTIIKNGILERI